MITGKINIAGYYKDGFPSLIINVKKEAVQSISFPCYVRTPITLDILGFKYTAGIRSTKKTDLKICPDLLDESGREVRLTDLLLSLGYGRNDQIQMQFDRDRIQILTN